MVLFQVTLSDPNHSKPCLSQADTVRKWLNKSRLKPEVNETEGVINKQSVESEETEVMGEGIGESEVEDRTSTRMRMMNR